MDQVRYTTLSSPLGDLLLHDHGRGLSGLTFPGHRGAPTPAPGWQHEPAAFTAVAEQLAAYLAGELTAFALSLDLRGTELQRTVWAELCRCPYGRTTTYGELARRVGRPGAARAVAGAVGRNPVAIVVPCHRVIGADGRLTGYAGGLQRKRWLLAHEGVPVA